MINTAGFIWILWSRTIEQNYAKRTYILTLAGTAVMTFMVRKVSGKISGKIIKAHFQDGRPLLRHIIVLPARMRTRLEFTYSHKEPDYRMSHIFV